MNRVGSGWRLRSSRRMRPGPTSRRSFFERSRTCFGPRTRGRASLKTEDVLDWEQRSVEAYTELHLAERSQEAMLFAVPKRLDRFPFGSRAVGPHYSKQRISPLAHFTPCA